MIMLLALSSVFLLSVLIVLLKHMGIIEGSFLLTESLIIFENTKQFKIKT